MTIQQAHIGRVRLTRRGIRHYCTCAVCKQEYNVSPHQEVYGQYVCPICAKKSRPEAATPWAARKNNTPTL